MNLNGIVCAFALFLLSLTAYSASGSLYPDIPRFLVERPRMDKAVDKNLKGQPYSVSTYKANEVSEWGNVFVSKTSNIDSIVYNADGTIKTRFLSETIGNKPAQLYEFYHSSKLDSVLIYDCTILTGGSHSTHVDGRKYDYSYPYVKDNYNWVAEDSVVIRRYTNDNVHCGVQWNCEPYQQWGYFVDANEVRQTVYLDKFAKPHFTVSRINGGLGVRNGNHAESLFDQTNLDILIDPEFHISNGWKNFFELDRFNIKFDEYGRITCISPTSEVTAKLLKTASSAKRNSYKTLIYTYNPQGDVIQKKVEIHYTDEDKQTHKKIWKKRLISNVSYSYKYDDHNNWIFVKAYDSEKPANQSQFFVRDIVYYDSPDYKKIKMEEIESDNRVSAESDKYYLQVQESPLFPGGSSELYKYLNEIMKNISGIEGSGRFVFEIYVNKEGLVSPLSKLKSSTYDGENKSYIAEQLLDNFKNMPKWKPGMNNGQPVNSIVILPVVVRHYE